MVQSGKQLHVEGPSILPRLSPSLPSHLTKRPVSRALGIVLDPALRIGLSAHRDKLLPRPSPFLFLFLSYTASFSRYMMPRRYAHTSRHLTIICPSCLPGVDVYFQLWTREEGKLVEWDTRVQGLCQCMSSHPERVYICTRIRVEYVCVVWTINP